MTSRHRQRGSSTELLRWAARVALLSTFAGCNSEGQSSSDGDSYGGAAAVDGGGSRPASPATDGSAVDPSGGAGPEASEPSAQGSGGTGASGSSVAPAGSAGAASGDDEAAGAAGAGASSGGSATSGSSSGGAPDVDAGSGGAGTAGSLGEAGTAGTASGGAGGGGSDTPRDPCEPELVAAEPPVTFAATLHCSQGAVSIAPLSQDASALVAATSGGNVFLAELSPNGVSLENTGIEHAYAKPFVFVQEDDAPWIIATARDESGISLWTPAEPTWTSELIVPSDYTEYSGFLTPPTLAAAVSSTGKPLVFYRDNKLVLTERSAPSMWVATDVSDALDDLGAMAVDTLGRIRIAHARASYSGKQVEEWTDGNVLSYGQEDSGIWALAGAAGLRGTFGVARVVDEGTVVSVSDGTTRLNEQVIAEAQGLLSSRDCSAPITCGSNSCDVKGATRVAMASTSDGAFWVAYNLRHFDLEVTRAEDAEGNCQTTGGEDRSSEQLVLARVTADASVAPSARWSVPIAFEEIRDLQLAARGSSLYVGVAETNTTRVFAFDSATL